MPAVEAQQAGQRGRQDAFGDPQQIGHLGRAPFGLQAFEDGGAVLGGEGGGNVLDGTQGGNVLEGEGGGNELGGEGGGNILEGEG